MNAIIGLGATLALLLLAGIVVGLLDRKNFAPLWLLIAALLVAINDFALTGLYGNLPDLFPDASRNWQGKLLALALSLAIAALAIFGWRRVGLTLNHTEGSLKAAIPVLLLYCAFFVVMALIFPDDGYSAEDIAFQLTLPGLEEEIFYRGILLFALYRAFTGRVRLLGVDWGWGAILSCLLFGLTHAFGFSDGQCSFDPLYMALTAFPALIGVWLRLRTGSLLIPILMHNFGNVISMLI